MRSCLAISASRASFRAKLGELLDLTNFFCSLFQLRERYARHAVLLPRVSPLRFESDPRLARVFSRSVRRSPSRRIEQVRLLHPALLRQQQPVTAERGSPGALGTAAA